MPARWLLMAGLWLCVFLSSVGRAEFIPPMPEDLDQTDFSLITVGFGEGVHTAFGHSIVRVVDRKARTDMAFNWGVFDFSDPWFLFNFAYGRLNYRMAIHSVGATLRVYQYERRKVVENRLHLTVDQKRRIMEKIIWQAQPENLYYAYHYYYDNCSTRVRDYLDFALQGALKERFGTSEAYPHDLTLRQSIQSHFDDFPLIGMATDIVMNSDLEDVMTAWEEMYLPGALQKYLRGMAQVDELGQEIPGSSLLGPDQVLLDFPAPSAAPLNGYQIVFLLLGLPVIGGAFLIWRVPALGSVGVRLFGLGTAAWGLLAGLFSLAMIWYWAVSVHTHGFHNANLWLMWPTDLLWFWYGLNWLKKGERLKVDSCAKRIVWYAAWAHLICVPLFLLLYVSGILKQDVSNPLLYLAPITFICSLVTVRWVLVKERLSHNEPAAIA